MATQKEIRNQIETLIKTNQISEPTQLSLPNFVTKDLYPLVYQYFNADALKILTNKSHGTVYQYNKQISNSPYADHYILITPLLANLGIKSARDFVGGGYVRHAAMVYYFGYRVQKGDIGKAAMEMVKVINDMCSKQYALATLEQLSTMEFYDGSHAVYSYLAIDHQYEAIVKSTYGHCMFPEGGIPPELK